MEPYGSSSANSSLPQCAASSPATREWSICNTSSSHCSSYGSTIIARSPPAEFPLIDVVVPQAFQCFLVDVRAGPLDLIAGHVFHLAGQAGVELLLAVLLQEDGRREGAFHALTQDDAAVASQLDRSCAAQNLHQPARLL